MILRRQPLSAHPTVFRAMSAPTGPLFAELDELLPAYRQARAKRLDRPDRCRAQGGDCDSTPPGTRSAFSST